MYNEIIPDEYQIELMAIRDADTKSSFRVGDIVNDLLQTSSDRNTVYSAVGSFVGKASRTVREYAMVSRFYPPAARNEYCILSFEHFRVAMRYGSDWQAALEWAVQQVETMNRPATIDAMTIEFEGDSSSENYQENPINEIVQIMHRLHGLLQKSEFSREILVLVTSVLGAIENEIVKAQ